MEREALEREGAARAAGQVGVAEGAVPVVPEQEEQVAEVPELEVVARAAVQVEVAAGETALAARVANLRTDHQSLQLWQGLFFFLHKSATF
jgi:hypothetical protein